MSKELMMENVSRGRESEKESKSVRKQEKENGGECVL